MFIGLTGSHGMVGQNFIEAAKGKHEIIPIPRLHEDDTPWGRVPDIIIHAGGLVGGIKANIANPFDFLYHNARCGLEVIKAAKEFGIPRLINLGSSCMYSPQSSQPFREEDLFKGEPEPTNEGYAIAKRAVARLAGYAGYKTLVPCNLYGRHDHFRDGGHLIADVIYRAIVAKRYNYPLAVWKPDVRREFMYAGDFAQCLLRAVENYDSLPDIMNVGCEQDYSIDEYYETIIDVVGFQGRLLAQYDAPRGMVSKKVDITKMKQWGWMPQTDIVEGIRKAVEWYNTQ